MSATTRRTAPTPGSHSGQLILLDGGKVSNRREWQLDERTRRIGRMGVAQARAILKGARPPQPPLRPGERRAS